MSELETYSNNGAKEYLEQKGILDEIHLISGI